MSWSQPPTKRVGHRGLPSLAPHRRRLGTESDQWAVKTSQRPEQRPSGVTRTELLEHVMSAYCVPRAAGTGLPSRQLCGDQAMPQAVSSTERPGPQRKAAQTERPCYPGVTSQKDSVVTGGCGRGAPVRSGSRCGAAGERVLSSGAGPAGVEPCRGRHTCGRVRAGMTQHDLTRAFLPDTFWGASTATAPHPTSLNPPSASGPGADSQLNKFSSVQFSHSVVSDSLKPHEPQHTRPSCPSPTPRDYLNSCSLSQ